MQNIPEEYVIQKFYQHAGYPKYVKTTNTYMGGCPICREGKSWGRKSRCYYIPGDSVICCHNCGWYGSTINWILEVEKITYQQMMQQIDDCDYEYGIPSSNNVTEKPTTETLPKDCINLFDRSQLSYYSNEPIVRNAVDVVVRRRLNTAVNRPKSLYVSTTDYIHKNRLVIPFYNQKNVCEFYQTRKLLDDETPKYLSKSNSEKTLFNYNNIDCTDDNVFITEGPIDSFFIKNSVAVAGIQERSKQSLTNTQREQLNRLFLMQTVWVLDSQWLDLTSREKSKMLLDQGQCVFLWPKDIGKQFKDINDICMKFKIDQISHEYILKNTFCGLKGLVRLNQIK